MEGRSSSNAARGDKVTIVIVALRSAWTLCGRRRLVCGLDAAVAVKEREDTDTWAM
jgi:hypothetical protein